MLTLALAAGCGTGSTVAPAGTGTTVTATAGTATAGTATAGPGQTVTVGSEPPSTPPASPDPSALDEPASGSTIRLRVGQMAGVDLPAGYDPPRSSSTAMRRVSADGGYPTGRPVHARFVAAAPGTADLTSMTDAACLHATPPCMMAQRGWTVHVVVTP